MGGEEASKPAGLVPPDSPRGEGIPPLVERIRGVLLAPRETFRALDPAWGILGPWLAIAAAGLLLALVHVARGDAKHLAAERWAYQQTFFTDQQRRALAQAESSVDMSRWISFSASVGTFAAPTLGSILAIVAGGIVLLGASTLLGGRRDLLGSIVVAAHAKLVLVVGYGILALALLLGNPEPATSLKNVADEVANPAAAIALDVFDPIAIWHAVLIAIGLACALRVKPRRAAAFGVAFYLVPWGFLLASAFASSALSNLSRR